MKNKLKQFIKKFLIVISIVLYIVIGFSIVNERPTFADSGFSTSHSSGHSSSSSHSSSHSSSSSGRSSSSSRRSSSSSYSGGSSGDMSLALGILFILILYFIFRALVKSSNKSPQIETSRNIDDTKVENEVKKYIPNFNKTEFLNNCYKMYCDIQVAWMDFKLEDVRDLLTDELYTMYESQLATLEVKGEQNIMKGFDLKKCYLKGVVKQNDTITITTGYVIDFYDYIAEQATGKTIRGNSKQKMRVTYEMKFRQSLNPNDKVENCPNCGAKVEVNNSGICEYCKSKLVAENTKWVLTEKKSLNQYYV